MNRVIAAFVLILSAASALADQWLPATPHTYASYFGNYRLTVFPRRISDPLSFFQDKVEGAQPAGQLVNAPQRCEATLERLAGNHYEELWRHPLVNDVAPVSVLVSDRSGAFVTFDTWHAVGCCKDTIVIYDSAGTVIRMFELSDLLSDVEIDQLQRTVSSTHWGGEHDLAWVEDEEIVELAIVANGKFPSDADAEYKTVQIRMRDGAVVETSNAPPN
ncbi:MAG: hypothetical protein WD793_15175 [Steroidobacteraceae bacterium]